MERAGGDASVLCGFGRCFCVKTALGISGGKERGHWPQFQESERSNRVLLGTAIAAFDSLESGAKDSNIRQTMVWLLSENATQVDIFGWLLAHHVLCACRHVHGNCLQQRNCSLCFLSLIHI